MVSEAVFFTCLIYIGLQLCVLYLVDYLPWTTIRKYGNITAQHTHITFK